MSTPTPGSVAGREPFADWAGLSSARLLVATDYPGHESMSRAGMAEARL